MSEPSVGSVSVDVVPDARRFSARVRREVTPEAKKIGDEFGKVFGDAAQQGMAGGVRAGLRRGGVDAARQGAKIGDEYAGGMARAFRTRIQAALRDLPDVKLGADSSEADRAIAGIRENLQALRDREIGVDVDVAEASLRLDALRDQLERLAAQSPDVQVRVDTASAAAQLARFQAEVSRLDGRTLSVDVDVDTAAASAQMGLLRGQAAGAGGSFAALVAAAALLGPALIPVGAVAVGAMAAVASGALAAAGGVGVLLLALVPVVAAVQAVRAAEDKSAASARASTGAHLQMASAMDAVKAANRGLASAEEDAQVTRVRAAEAVADAERSLVEAKRQGALDQAEAGRRIVDAERSVADAQRDALDAQRALSDARKQAARDAEDLASRVAGGILDERDANLRLEEARQRAAEVNADPNAAALERQRAQLAVDQAVLGLQRQQQENTRLAAQKAASDKAGVDGSQAVQDAQDRLAESQRRLGEAQEGVTQAVEAGAERRRRATESVADAQQNVADATRDAADQQRRSAEAITTAQQAVVAAQRGVQQASQAAGASGGAAMDTVREKLAALTPEGRSFVEFINAKILPAFKGLSGAAQAGFLPGFQRGLEALQPAIPGLTRFVGDLAETMGDLAAEAGEALTSPFWRDFFDFVSETAGPALKTMGRTFGNVLTGIAGLIKAFAPNTKDFGDGILGMSRRFAEFGKGAGKNEGFQGFLAYLKENGPKVVDTIGTVAGAFGHILTSLAPLGPPLLAVVKGVSDFVSSIPPPVLAGIVLGIGAVAAALAVMSASPVVLITAAIVGLVLGVVKLYQESETFRTVVQAAWRLTKEAISAAWDVIKGIWQAISDFITVTLPAAFRTGVDTLKDLWRGFRDTVSSVWDKIRGIFDAVWTYIRDTVAAAFRKEVDGLKAVWTGFKNLISFVWDKISGVFDKVYGYIRDVVVGLFQREVNALSNVWTGFKAVISATWDKITAVFDKLGSYISDHVAGAFQTGVNAIARAWNGLKDAAKGPVRFVVDTVINDGLIGTFNKIASYFHVDPVDKISLPKGFATGGYVTGPGGPRDDLIPAMLSNGEFVINAQATASNLELLKYLNRGGSLGGDPGGVARFATGGLVEATKKWLPSVDPDPYVWGAVGPSSWDCSGLAGEVWARVTEHARNSRYFTTNSNLRNFGFAPGTGMLTLGLDPGHHVVGNLAGLGFEARSTASGVFVGPSATDPASMPQQWYLAQLPGGPDSPDGISLLNPLGSIRSLFGGLLDGGFNRFTDNPFGQLMMSMPKAAVAAAGDFISDHVPGFADGGLVGKVAKYDDGGYLPPGLSTVVNLTGKPEPVLTSGQWSSMKGSGVDDRPPVVINQTIHNPIPEVPSESLARGMRRVSSFGLLARAGQ